jgi:hypothetical protein
MGSNIMTRTLGDGRKFAARVTLRIFEKEMAHREQNGTAYHGKGKNE